MSITQSVVKAEDLDLSFAKTLEQLGIERVLTCMQCGTCTASCPSGRYAAYRTRLVLRKVLLGLREEILSDPDLWLCTTCYNCQERCPRKIDVVDLIIVLRNMAFAAGHARERHVQISKFFIETGHLVPINEENMKKRRELGLSEKPPTTHSFPKALEEVKALASYFGFDKIVLGER